jgi:hypothetical protein
MDVKNKRCPTHGIVHAGFRGLRRFVARKKCRFKLIGNRFVIPHNTIPSNVDRSCLPSVGMNDQRPGGSADGHRSVVSLRSPRNDNSRLYAIRFPVPIPPRDYRKVAADFCSDQGAMKEHSLSSATEEQRRAGRNHQDLVCKILVVWALNTSYLSSGRTYSRPPVSSYANKKNK